MGALSEPAHRDRGVLAHEPLGRGPQVGQPTDQPGRAGSQSREVEVDAVAVVAVVRRDNLLQSPEVMTT